MPCATEYNVFRRPASICIQSVTASAPLDAAPRVQIHLRLVLQEALYVKGEHGAVGRWPAQRPGSPLQLLQQVRGCAAWGGMPVGPQSAVMRS